MDTISTPSVSHVSLPVNDGSFSYWELKHYFTRVDFTVVGGGIVGLSTALYLQRKYPKAKVVVLERSLLPKGASTKNAGFACYGSVSELLDDMNLHTEEEMVKLVKRRYKGIHRLRRELGDKHIGFRQYGGYEMFIRGNPDFYEACLEHRERLNKLLYPVFKDSVFKVKRNEFGFDNVQDALLYNKYEAQLDTGKMMHALLVKCLKKGVKVLNGFELEGFEEVANGVALKTNHLEFATGKLFITTNGFASRFLEADVKPARNQVLITEPLEKLPFKGCFHIENGFYYFRNINNRILLGGGRNMDLAGEETSEFGLTPVIQQRLESLLREVILPGTDVGIAHRWSGILGVGTDKKPIVKALSPHVYCGVRMGGMGVALGSQTGYELAEMVE